MDSLAPAEAAPHSAHIRQSRPSSAFAMGTLRVIAAASAPSASTHFASGLTPTSSSSVDSSTPVHSQHITKPWVC